MSLQLLFSFLYRLLRNTSISGLEMFGMQRSNNKTAITHLDESCQDLELIICVKLTVNYTHSIF